jgi:hypothetical protein
MPSGAKGQKLLRCRRNGAVGDDIVSAMSRSRIDKSVLATTDEIKRPAGDAIPAGRSGVSRLQEPPTEQESLTTVLHVRDDLWATVGYVRSIRLGLKLKWSCATFRHFQRFHGIFEKRAR